MDVDYDGYDSRQLGARKWKSVATSGTWYWFFATSDVSARSSKFYEVRQTQCQCKKEAQRMERQKSKGEAIHKFDFCLDESACWPMQSICRSTFLWTPSTSTTTHKTGDHDTQASCSLPSPPPTLLRLRLRHGCTYRTTWAAARVMC